MAISAISATYSISKADIEDVEQVMTFIGDHWRANHIFTYHQELFQWQHFDPRDKSLNFILARDNASTAILGILGFIDTSLYDYELTNDKVLWLAIWAVDPNCKVAGLGLALRGYLQKHETSRAIGTLGFSEKTALLYQAFKYEIGNLDRYYMVNCRKNRFQLIQNFDGRYSNQLASTEVAKELIPIDIDSFDQFESDYNNHLPDEVLPRKSPRYFMMRYLKHPIYSYRLFGIREAGNFVALISTRKAEAQDSAALRIVDYLGPDSALVGLSRPFQDLLSESDSEYLDFYCLGIPEKIFEQAGLLTFSSSQSMILPNYFEPLEFQNVDINYAVKSTQGSTVYRFFKGDCDQDRPNYLR